MLKKKDLYTHNKQSPIQSSDTIIGQSIAQYEVQEYTDTRNLLEQRSYLVTCTQRIIIPNADPYYPGPKSTSGFENYPAMLMNQISCAAENIMEPVLVSYYPRTLNTAVMSDHSNSDSTGGSYSKEHTSGSSTSQTNSYGTTDGWNISGNIGAMGDVPTGGISGGYDHSDNYTSAKTSSHEISDSATNMVNHDNQFSNSSSMSIKDWGSYAIIDTKNQTPTWVWGQEYPWDVVQFNNKDENNKIILPEFVQSRLCEKNKDGKVTLVYPPTQLSLFGIDFVSKASWIITCGSLTDMGMGKLKFTHALKYCTASHKIDEDVLVASLDATHVDNPIIITSDPLDCYLLGLDPITDLGIDNGAIIGFLLDKFIISPFDSVSTGKPFKIISGANNLLVTGTGFITQLSEDGGVGTDFSNDDVEIDISFKILDSSTDYELFLKCWKIDATGCELNIVINNDTKNAIFKHVDSLETKGGENNVISITLRNKDYTSGDYSDHLKMGLNSIKITITPSKDSKNNNDANGGFFLRTLAIG